MMTPDLNEDSNSNSNASSTNNLNTATRNILSETATAMSVASTSTAASGINNLKRKIAQECEEEAPSSNSLSNDASKTAVLITSNRKDLRSHTKEKDSTIYKKLMTNLNTQQVNSDHIISPSSNKSSSCILTREKQKQQQIDATLTSAKTRLQKAKALQCLNLNSTTNTINFVSDSLNCASDNIASNKKLTSPSTAGKKANVKPSVLDSLEVQHNLLPVLSSSTLTVTNELQNNNSSVFDNSTISKTLSINDQATENWLNTFKELNSKAKLSALEQLLELCDHSHIKHVHNFIEPKLQRDYISELPRELILLLLTYVRPKDLYKLSQVSHYWHQIANDPILWKNICKKNQIAVSLNLNNNEESEMNSLYYRNNGNMSYITNIEDEAENTNEEDAKNSNTNNNNNNQVNFNNLSSTSNTCDKKPMGTLITKIESSKSIDKDDFIEDNDEENVDEDDDDEEENVDDANDHDDNENETEENELITQVAINREMAKITDKFLSSNSVTSSIGTNNKPTTSKASTTNSSSGNGVSPSSPSSCSSTENSNQSKTTVNTEQTNSNSNNQLKRKTDSRSHSSNNLANEKKSKLKQNTKQNVKCQKTLCNSLNKKPIAKTSTLTKTSLQITQNQPNQQTYKSPYNFLHTFNKFKRAYLIDHNVTRNWCTRPLPRPFQLKSHDDHVITCLKFDGKRVVSGSDDNTLKIWCALTGKLLRTLSGHTGGVWASQLKDNIVISGSTDRTVRVWDIETGDCIHVLTGHTSTVRCLALNGKLVISGSRDSLLRVWNIESGECLQILRGHSAAVRCVCFDGKYVVSGSYDFTIRVWNPFKNECIHVLEGHVNRVYSLLFDGERIVSGSLDTTIIVWDVHTGGIIHKLTGHHSLTSGMQIKGDILVSGNADSTVKIWSLKTGDCLHTLSGCNKHMSAVTCLAFNEKFVVSSSDDGTVKLWNLETGEFIRNLLALESGGRGGVVWRISMHINKLVCAVGSRIGVEETKLILLDFDWPPNSLINNEQTSINSVNNNNNNINSLISASSSNQSRNNNTTGYSSSTNNLLSI